MHFCTLYATICGYVHPRMRRPHKKEVIPEMPDKKEQFEQLNQAIEELKDQPGALMPVMQRAQSIFGFLDVNASAVSALMTNVAGTHIQ